MRKFFKSGTVIQNLREPDKIYIIIMSSADPKYFYIINAESRIIKNPCNLLKRFIHKEMYRIIVS